MRGHVPPFLLPEPDLIARVPTHVADAAHGRRRTTTTLLCPSAKQCLHNIRSEGNHNTVHAKPRSTYGWANQWCFEINIVEYSHVNNAT